MGVSYVKCKREARPVEDGRCRFVSLFFLKIIKSCQDIDTRVFVAVIKTRWCRAHENYYEQQCAVHSNRPLAIVDPFSESSRSPLFLDSIFFFR